MAMSKVSVHKKVMRVLRASQIGVLLVLLSSPLSAYDLQLQPNVILNASDVASMAIAAEKNPIYAKQYQARKSALDESMTSGVNVPVPKDAGGGYTHEQHKLNAKLIHDAGIVYQISKESRYADFARDVLNSYASLYPSLGEHPKKKEQSPGRLFWQSLNEAVWLVYSIQGFDAIALSLSQEERDNIEQNLFMPMAKFLSEESPETFNKIHNHGTWAAAAVGMTGYALSKPKLVQQALLGLDQSGDAGFLKQLDKLFSPDGYYNEGPYYQRYALMPFILFARAIENNQPELEIFSYRNDVVKKAVYTALQLSYNKYFFPINDALKDKGIDSQELIYGVDIIYAVTQDPQLLSVAQLQNEILLSGDGVAVANALAAGKAEVFDYSTQLLSDGPQGKQGALAIIRSGAELSGQALVIKNTSQGMNHGHFDKLSWLFYDNSTEVINDYGAARYLNIEAKYGGHYLPENKSWAKQTIAHNTVVVDEKSHFEGKLSRAIDKSPTQLVFSESDSVVFSAASMTGVNKGVDLTRSMASLELEGFEHPVVIDVLKVVGDKRHQYDLPLYYQGQIININFPVSANQHQLSPLGDRNGYQHLWNKAEGNPEEGLAQVTWILKDRFYTYSQAAKDDSSMFFVELGANDPNFNLRRENGLITRVKDVKNKTFVSVLEPHGKYDPRLERTSDSYSQIDRLDLQQVGDYDLITIGSKSGKQWVLLLSYNADETQQHKISVDGKIKRWKGFYHFFEASL
jgi:hypothetical protein